MDTPESAIPSPSSSIAYSPKTQHRAARAVRCSPFRLKLLQDLRSHSVALGAIAEDRGIRNGYTRQPLPERTVESELLWLMAIGLLRREVDGQGLTDSFRLTPLGRLLLSQWEAQGIPDLQPAFQDHLYNSMSRWFRLPGWFQ